MAIDRFDIDVSYVYRNGKDIISYSCGNYFAQKYNSEDRVNLLHGDGADIIVRNSIIITVNGLASKWEDVLKGKKSWIDAYRKSSRFLVGRLQVEELEIIERYF